MPAAQSVERGCQRNHRLPRAERLHLQRDFDRLRKKGRRRTGKHFVLLYEIGGIHPMFGIAVGRIVGNAVKRTSVRRCIRESYRLRRTEIRPSRMLIIARKGSAELSCTDTQQELDHLWKTAGIIC